MFDSKLNSLLVLSVTNSITKTAEIVHLTQPSVTSQIKSLEEEYGIKIFLKNGNNITITPEGMLLIKHAEKIKAAYTAMSKEIENFKSNIQTIKVGVTSGIGSSFISSILAEFANEKKKKYEEFKVALLYDISKRLITKLYENEITCIITDEKIDDHNIKKEKIDEGKLMCLVAPNHPIANLDKITLNELKKYDLLIRLPNSSTQILFDATLRTHDLNIKDFKILMELNSISAIKNLTKKGIAAAILPNTSCITEINKKELIAIPIEEVNATHIYYIYYREDFSHTEIINNIKEYYQLLKN